MNTNNVIKRLTSVPTLTLLASCVAVSIVTFLTGLLDIGGTVVQVAISFIGLGILGAVGIDIEAHNALGPMVFIPILSALAFAIPATVVLVATRSWFRGWLSILLILLWLLGFSWAYYLAPRVF